MSTVEVGPYSYYDTKPKVRSWKNEGSKLTIGRFCSIASGLDVILGGNHLYKRISQYPLNHYFTDEKEYTLFLLRWT